MKRKIIRVVVIVAGILFFGYHSLYIKKLDEVKTTSNSGQEIEQEIEEMWSSQIPQKMKEAIDVSLLEQEFKHNSDSAFARYTHSLAIGNYGHVLIHGSGWVEEVTPDEILCEIDGDPSFSGFLELEFIYGNSVRDALNLWNLQSFSDTDDLNKVSEELNKLIRSRIVPVIRGELKKGSEFQFVGVISLNKRHIDFNQIKILPLEVTRKP